jgi:hypothetical protein
LKELISEKNISTPSNVDSMIDEKKKKFLTESQEYANKFKNIIERHKKSDKSTITILNEDSLI